MAVYGYVTGIGGPIGIAIGVGIEQPEADGVSAAGQSAGTSTAVGVGASNAYSAGTSAGTSTAVGVAVGDIFATGTSAGTSTASGVGASDAYAVGASAGLATAQGVGTGTTKRIVRMRSTVRVSRAA